jgi:putative transposase
VSAGVDKETADFYRKGNIASLIGDDSFKQWVYEELIPELESTEKSRIVRPDLTMKEILTTVANHYGVDTDELTALTRGHHKDDWSILEALLGRGARCNEG